ncbi:Hypothetical protein FKW44_004659, partial [Caligus rogercresseyi]
KKKKQLPMSSETVKRSAGFGKEWTRHLKSVWGGNQRGMRSSTGFIPSRRYSEPPPKQ